MDQIDSDTARCYVSVIEVEAMRGGGRVIAIASLLVMIEGVEMTLRGVKLVKHHNANVTVEMPATRDAMGRMVPLVSLPSEIERAIDLAVRRMIVETVAERQAASAFTSQRH